MNTGGVLKYPGCWDNNEAGITCTNIYLTSQSTCILDNTSNTTHKKTPLNNMNTEASLNKTTAKPAMGYPWAGWKNENPPRTRVWRGLLLALFTRSRDSGVF
jgi:hypothetical protein